MPRKQTRNYRKKSFRRKTMGRRVKKDGGSKNRLRKTMRRRNHRRCGGDTNGDDLSKTEKGLIETLTEEEYITLLEFTADQVDEATKFLTKTFANVISNIVTKILIKQTPNINIRQPPPPPPPL